jgi:hypothetical protein
MANMSYCRFRNTLGDLRDCEESLLDDDLGEDENAARAALVRVCKRIVEQAKEAGLSDDELDE